MTATGIRSCKNIVREEPGGRGFRHQVFKSNTLCVYLSSTRQIHPHGSKFTELEPQLQEFARTRAIFELWLKVCQHPLLASVSYIDSLLFYFFQTAMSANRILLRSSLCKWHMLGSRPKTVHPGHLGQERRNCYLALLRLLPRKKNPIRVMMTRAMKLGANAYNVLDGANDEDVSSSEDKDKC